jgi:hypothetical protein
MSHGQDGDNAPVVVNGVEGAVLTTPDRPDLFERGVQRLAEPVGVGGDRTGQMLEQGGRGRKGELVEPAAGGRS